MAGQNGVIFSNWRNVLIADWFKNTTEPGVSEMGQELWALHAKQRKPIAIMHIVGVKSDPPSSGTRRRMAELFRDEQTKIAINATIIEGDGFRAASVRAVASGIGMLSKMSFPHEVFPTKEKATDRVVEYLQYDATSRMRLLEALQGAERLREDVSWAID